ncbi:MAG: peptidase domain-containing ABC transporter [Magnetococcales bacterium]|nr:peptidase domain-containing ABC transporter [Magnetococcales bacterium]
MVAVEESDQNSQPTVVEEPKEAPFPHTSVQCLSAIAQHHGVILSPDRLIHNYALAAEEPSLDMLRRIAEENGFKAKIEQADWETLTQKMRGLFPLLARLKNGNSVIVIGVHKAPDAEIFQVAVLDPLASRVEPILVGQDSFCRSWGGALLLLKRTYSITDPHQPFGLSWFIPEIWRQRTALRDIAIAVITLHFIALASPIFFQLVMDKVLTHESYSTLYVLSIGITIVILFEVAFSSLRQFLLLGATNKIDMRLARRTFSHLLSLPMDFFESTSAGLLVRHMQQVERIRQFLTGRLFLTLLDTTSLFIFLPLLFLYSGQLGSVVLIFALLIALVVVALIKPFRARLNDLYRAEAGRQSMLVETIHGMRTVKALAMEPVQRRQWEQKSAAAIGMYFRVGMISMSAVALTTVLERGMMVAVIALGAQLVFDHTLTVGALIAFQMISGRVVGPLVQIVSLVNEYQETSMSIHMLGEIMNRKPEGRDVGGLHPTLQGRIDFDAVTFRYPGSSIAALDRISLTFPPGSVIGIVGRSGSGKTTLTRMLQGMYWAQEGIIRIDGVDIREFDLAHLRQSIGVVLQENFMFRATIRENIAAANPSATFDQVVDAARKAGADEFIERLPQGYETILEENGSNLSGGQRQRLAIARAILPRPRILILDEAASALDPESEAIFMGHLTHISAGKTVLIVSHRLTMLTQSNAIVVLHQGAIADVGTHQELLSRCAIYQNLWHQQTKFM